MRRRARTGYRKRNLPEGAGRVAIPAGGGLKTLSITENLQGNWRADLGVTTGSSDEVTAWADQTDNGRNWGPDQNPDISTDGPTLVDDVLDGKPALRFEGSHALDQAAFFGGDDTHAIMYVVLRDGVRSGQSDKNFIARFGSSIFVPWWYRFDTEIQLTFGSDDRAPTNLGSDPPYRSANPVNQFGPTGVWTVFYDNGTLGSYWDGTLLHSRGSRDPGWRSRFSLGRTSDSVGNAENGYFDLFQVTIYDTVHSDDDRNQIISDLKSIWGLS